MEKIVRKYGHIKDREDARDFKYQVCKPAENSFPPIIDLIPLCPAVYDQVDTSTCTGNSIGGAIEFDLMKQGIDFMPSRLFIYWNERGYENSTDSDCGGMIRDGIKGVASLGVCKESTWGFIKENITVKPTDVSFTEALNYLALQYHSLNQDLVSMKSCLNEGYPFTAGIKVYDSFESDEVAKTGIVNLPTATEKLCGGHAILIVGYNDNTKRFTIRNSWGAEWGNQGYCTLPYEYILSPDLASDFWTIRLIK